MLLPSQLKALPVEPLRSESLCVIDDPITYQATIQNFFLLASSAVITEDLLCIHFSPRIRFLTVFAIIGYLVGVFVGRSLIKFQ